MNISTERAGWISAVAFLGAIAWAQSMVTDANPPEVSTNNLLACLPDEVGEKSILWLEHDAVLTLHCEKHESVGYGQVERIKAKKFAVAVAVE